MRCPAPARRRGERGAAALEFALVLTPLLYLVFGGVSYTYMLAFRQTLSQAASEGARAAVGASTGTACPATGPYTSACPAQQVASAAVASSLATYAMACGSRNLTCTISVGSSVVGCTTGHSCLSVVLSYPYRAQSLLPSVPGFGFALPRSLDFTSVVTLS